MADYKKNIFNIEGTIFAKPSRKITSKKDGKDYEFKSIILELKREYKGKTFVDFPEFQLGYGVSDDGFDVGDYVLVTFALTGKNAGSFHKTELKAIYIKHPDLQQGNDTRDVGGNPYPKKDKLPPAPEPVEEEYSDDLPF